ncbi:MAG: AAA family ATPase, partial [Anaerolineae bacterium]|nr:AAA family ATPase [Anaerolineae bacterium]
GQRSVALRQYRHCVRVLEEELGAAPSAETTALYEAVRATGPDLTSAEASPVASAVPHLTTLPLPAFLDDTERPVIAERPVFVGREPELARLDAYLGTALAGRGQVAFVVGGPGRGKTALLHAFADRAMFAHPGLLVVSGACNAFSGVGDAYLPFREALGMLTGDVETHWRAGSISSDQAQRLWSALSTVFPALVAHGPYVIDTLVSGSGVMSRAQQTGLGDATWMPELRTLSNRTTVSGLEQQALFQQVTNTLQAVTAAHPLILVLDDLQWADQGSIGLLFHLGRRLAGGRILVLGAYRPEEVLAGRASGPVSEPHPLANVLDEFKRQFGDVWIDLRRADETEGEGFVSALVDAEENRLGGGFRQALFARTKGYPLFTVELLHDLQARGDLVRDADGAWIEGVDLAWNTLPARIEAVIAARLGRLEPAHRDLLMVASVEGETFTVQVVASAAGLSEREALRTLSQELGARHLLVREVGERRVHGRFTTQYSFAHRLFREYLYRELSPAERRLLHGDVATIMEDLYGDASGSVAVQLAHHYDLAENTEKAAEYAVRAGEQAHEVYANDEAVRWYQRALALLDTSPQGEPGQAWRLTALTSLAKIRYRMGSVSESEAYFREAIVLARELHCDAQEIAVLCHWLGEALWQQSRYEERYRVGEEGLALAGGGTRSLGAALMNQTLAFGSYGETGDWERSRDITLATASFIQDLPWVEELAPAYVHICLVHLLDKDMDAYLEWNRMAAEKAKRLGGIHEVIAQKYTDTGKINWHFYTGDLTSTIQLQQRVLAVDKRLGDTRAEADVLIGTARCLLLSGELARAEFYISQALPLVKTMNSDHLHMANC